MKVFFLVFTYVSILLLSACNDRGNRSTQHRNNMQESENKQYKFTNLLAGESSPYLLQHAHNPVNWHPWNEAALKRAKDENKPILISIGYSACHWCHVMEHESFEDTSVAAIMNANFVCIKVDREERPDIDQVYMNAVQLLTGSGGWPLNCFALPDGRPFYGGTYFTKDQWKKLLLNISDAYRDQPQKLEDYAEHLTQNIRQSELIELKPGPVAFTRSTLEQAVAGWKKSFDSEEGGPNRAPKFPLPNNYRFLLRYGYFFDDKEVMDHVQLTLKKMAYGGIYDQAGGGFARYATDMEWKIPHFEKMLYDNAQLVSLYSEAFRYSRDPLYKNIVYQTLEFVGRELTGSDGAFYSSLDADSEGEEGRFYVWKKEELEECLKDDFPLARDYFNINAKGLWEHGNYILLRDEDDVAIASRFKMKAGQLHEKMESVRARLLSRRSERIRPGLDDKTLTSWNALMLTAYTDAYRAFREERFLKAALRNAQFITDKQLRKDGGLNHNYKNGKSSINGYLEDYAFTIEAFVSLYEVTFDERWLHEADKLAYHCIGHFFDTESKMFFFTSDLDSALIARKMEITDNVIPSSNSALATALFKLGHLLDKADYLEKSAQQLKNIADDIPKYGPGYSNWGILMLHHLFPFYEVAICGKEADEKRKELDVLFLPNKINVGSTQESNLPLLEHKYVEGETIIYVCVGKSCKLPVKSTEEALKQMQ